MEDGWRFRKNRHEGKKEKGARELGKEIWGNERRRIVAEQRQKKALKKGEGGCNKEGKGLVPVRTSDALKKGGDPSVRKKNQ